MIAQWKNDQCEAWTLDDGTLVVRTQVQDSREKAGFYYIVDTLPPIKAEAA
jgi:hypothetical protein